VISFTKVDEELSITHSLILGQCENAADVVGGDAPLFFAKVSDKVASSARSSSVILRDDVKKKRLDVVIKRLVIQIHLREQTQILAIHLQKREREKEREREREGGR
jgi:hypothetical protein